MARISLQDIPEEYELMKKEIFNKKSLDLAPLYSKFKFSYINLSSYNEAKADNCENPIQGEIDILYNYFKSYRFIVYHFPDLIINDTATNNLAKSAIICVEKLCLIIEFDDLCILLNLVEKLKKEGNICISTNENKEIIEELNNFYQYFISKKPISLFIRNNIFVKYTIKSISLYIIRRFFYPTNYFLDPSFFIFDQTKESKEQKIKETLVNISKSQNLKEIDDAQLSIINQRILTEFKDPINDILDNKFDSSDIIVLRTIKSTYEALFKLVIHVKILHVFMMKEIFKEFKYEENFVRHYSHRCLTKFYGFVIKEERIVGYIYEFLSNGTIYTLIEKHPSQINEYFVLLAIIRLCQAIEYLHSNSLIHRDIKTHNILLDHDFIPYLSDFDTIKDISEGDNMSCNEIKKTMTYDLGSPIFISPEQEIGDPVSYPTDIYSFGIVINKLYEALLNKSQNEIFINDGLSKICNYLCKSCIKKLPIERLTIADIKLIIKNYIHSFEYPYLYEINLLNKMNAINFTLECLFLNEEDFQFSSEALQNFITFYWFLSNIKNEAIQANLIGNFFYDNNDFLKALKYYKMSADMGNSDGQVNYGTLHYYGQGVKQDYSEAKRYFELAADQKNVSYQFCLFKNYLK